MGAAYPSSRLNTLVVSVLQLVGVLSQYPLMACGVWFSKYLLTENCVIDHLDSSLEHQFFQGMPNSVC